MAGGTPRRRLVLFVGTVFVAIFLAGQAVANSESSCALNCDCPNKNSCTRGSAKSECCWSAAQSKCLKIVGSVDTDPNNCGSCGNVCNSATQFGRVCVAGQCECGRVGQPCCQNLLDGLGYENSCRGASGLESGCNSVQVGCSSNSCTCKCVDGPGDYSGNLPDIRPQPSCP